MKVRVQLSIEGRVQGVFFRQSTAEMARQLGLEGWVRNCPDGRVEAIFEGAQDQVLQAVKWCQEGPPAAQVTHLGQEWQDYTGEFREFRIRY